MPPLLRSTRGLGWRDTDDAGRDLTHAACGQRFPWRCPSRSGRTRASSRSDVREPRGSRARSRDAAEAVLRRRGRHRASASAGRRAANGGRSLHLGAARTRRRRHGRFVESAPDPRDGLRQRRDRRTRRIGMGRAEETRRKGGRSRVSDNDKVLLRRYHEEGDLQAREQLIEQYMSLVRSLARRYSYRGEQLEDLVQIGAIGLIKAIDRFDIDRGVELTTYATPNIIGEIKRHFRDKGWSVRVPRGLQELNVRLSHILEELTVQLERSPTIPELAKAAGVDEEDVLEALESGQAYATLSLSAPAGGDENSDLDPLESLGELEHEYEVSEDRAVLAPGLRVLDERERRILHLRFFEGLTQSQIAYFLGREAPPAQLTTTAQKCFRTPDIDEVGLDGHHLTFFEMLGNFSFGQYFKAGAVELATEFIREHLRLDWDRIWVTVHAGDPQLGLGEDEVAIELWERIGVPRERIVGLPSSENFWSVGGPGPCGPDSEIYFDYGEEYGCGEAGCAPACPRCDRFLEFWNLVFMEYELHADRTLTPLPKQNVDTGMGVERLAAIMQGVRSVYETDGYQAIMTWIEQESGVAWDESEAATKAHRILADHGRGMTFLVGDGVIPSNEGRGYVLRRIIRRAVQQARKIGLDDLWRLSDVVVEQTSAWYPELEENRAQIREVLKAEEERFSETLARGLKLFEEVASKGDVSAADAFTLTATYGFPIELTRELARDRGLAVDDDGFAALMAEHREISRAGGERSELQRAADFARDAGFVTDFVGWEKTEALTQIGALEELGDGTFLAKLRESPFYPEGGGQVSDHGWLEKDGVRAELE